MITTIPPQIGSRLVRLQKLYSNIMSTSRNNLARLSHGNDRTKTFALIAVSLSSFLIPFSGTSATVALPMIGQEFKMDAVLLGWISTGFLIASATLVVPFGRFSDIYGRKRTFVWGTVTVTLASLLSAFSNSAGLMIVSRVLLGVGSAMIFGTGASILSSVFPPQEKGKALGIYSGTVYLGASLGPFVGGLLAGYFGWRSVFLANIPFCVTAIYLTQWKMKGEWAEAIGEKYDLTGSIIFGLAVAVSMYGFTTLPEISGIWFLLAGALGLAVFFKFERIVTHPILNIDAFRHNRVFTMSIFATLLNYCSTFGVSFLLSLYFQYNRGFSPQSAGLLLVIQPAFQALVSPFAGRISDRVDPRVVASSGMAITTISLALFSFMGTDTELVFAIIGLVLLGAGLGLFSSPNVNSVMSSVEKKVYGVSSAVQATMRLTGSMISMGIVMITFSLLIGRAQITAENSELLAVSVRIAFTIFTVLSFCAIFASLARGNVRKPLATSH
jgi:MFS family permease